MDIVVIASALLSVALAYTLGYFAGKQSKDKQQ